MPAFFHPKRGYWETDGRPGAFTGRRYPLGTIEVPPRPSPTARWTGSGWAEEAERPPPPETVRVMQFWLALLKAPQPADPDDPQSGANLPWAEGQDLLGAVRTWIARQGPQRRAEVEIRLRHAQEVHASHPMLRRAAGEIGITAEQFEDLFRFAATLE